MHGGDNSAALQGCPQPCSGDPVGLGPRMRCKLTGQGLGIETVSNLQCTMTQAELIQ
jgi:hypothetical protein